MTPSHSASPRHIDADSFSGKVLRSQLPAAFDGMAVPQLTGWPTLCAEVGVGGDLVGVSSRRVGVLRARLLTYIQLTPSAAPPSPAAALFSPSKARARLSRKERRVIIKFYGPAVCQAGGSAAANCGSREMRFPGYGMVDLSVVREDDEFSGRGERSGMNS